MRIHDLVIDNFRAIEHLELHDLPDTGVIVIHGDNERPESPRFSMPLTPC